MQQINKTTQLFPDILLFSYLGKPWTCHGMPNRVPQILQDLSNDMEKEEHYNSNSF